MKNAFRSAAVITLFSFSSQVVLFVSQVISAAYFGADFEMDAFLAASTLPQYVISVLLGSLAFVFIPVFIDYKTRQVPEQAYALAVSLFNNCVLVLTMIAVLGIVFARPLIEITAPGLSDESMNLSVKVAIITWPSILASGAISLLSSIYQAERKFLWQAAVPFIGAIVNLSLLLAFGKWLGVIGLALATSASLILQALLLFKVITGSTPYQFKLNWDDQALRHILRLLAPLLFVAILTKFTPLIERYLASELPEGSISHLNYAFKIAAAITILVTVGGSTVIFPKMATNFSNNDLEGLNGTISFGLRMMWIIIAPVITIGLLLALPIVRFLFERGEFSVSDSLAVSQILRIYLVALIGMCLGNITGKGFYVLKDTKTLAIFGTIEIVAYAIYAVILTRWMGVVGIAVSYAIYFNVSLIWQLLVLKNRVGNLKNLATFDSFVRTAFAAGVGALASYGILQLPISNSLLLATAGGIVGISAYLITLVLVRSTEMELILDTINRSKRKPRIS